VSGKQQKSASAEDSSVWEIAFSPDGELFAAATSHIKTPETESSPAEYDHNVIQIWDAKMNSVKMELEGHSNIILAFAFSPDGSLLVSADGSGAIFVWDIASGKQIAALQANGRPVRDVAFSPDGKLIATGGYDGVVRLWGVPTA
jgi:WD40 repeat protein